MRTRRKRITVVERHRKDAELRKYLSNFLREKLPMEFPAEAQKLPWASVGLSEATQKPASGTSPMDKAKQSLDSYWDC
jgi:hypothetical protein